MSKHMACLAILTLLVLGGCSTLPRSPERVTALETRADVTYQAGLRQYREGRFVQAALCFEQALAIAASVDDRPGTARALASLGRARLALGEQDAAAAAFQRSLDAAGGLARPDLEAEALGGLAAVALSRRRPDDARAWLQTGLALPLADPGPARAVLLHDLGMALIQSGRTADAEAQLRRALAMHEALNDPLGVAADCFSLAALRAEAGDLDEAADLARRALSRDKAEENPVGVAQDLDLLGALAARSWRGRRSNVRTRRPRPPRGSPSSSRSTSDPGTCPYR
ncbi:MAG: tetratricopeptide repeat protein [Candidatus Krumholzibacteriia bacterium]